MHRPCQVFTLALCKTIFVTCSYFSCSCLKIQNDNKCDFTRALKKHVDPYININLSGIDHIGGDMFESVPRGEVVLLQVITKQQLKLSSTLPVWS